MRTRAFDSFFISGFGLFALGILTWMSVIGIPFAFAGTLSCTVASSCATGTVMFRMYSTSNSHAELPTSSNYSNLVCCWGVSGLGNSCSGTYATVLKLSSTTNAHAEQNWQSNYSYNACLQAPSGGAVSVGYTSTTTCAAAGFDTTVATMATTTNAHVGNAAAYAPPGGYNVCASANGLMSITLTLSSSTVSIGSLVPGIGVPSTATTTATVSVTGGTNGYNLSLESDSATSTMALGTTGFPDLDPRWDPTANGNAGNAATAPGQTFTFRVQSSGTTSNYNSTWWGASDNDGTAQYGGFATTSQQIMNCTTCNAGSTDTTVKYRADGPASQSAGNYTGQITYTALTNP